MSKIYYSQSAHGFYDDSIIGRVNMPVDVIEISAEKHSYLLKEIGFGKSLVVKDGDVIAVQFRKRPENLSFIRESLMTSSQTLMNKIAQDYGYRSIDEAVSFASEPSDEQFYREGIAFRYWRSQVRRACIDLSEEIYRTESLIPRAHHLENILPKFNLIVPTPTQILD